MVAVYLFILLLASSIGFLEADRILHLPGVQNFTSEHYSGYLDAGDGRVLFYWYVI